MPETYYAKSPMPPQEGQRWIMLATPTTQLYPAHVASVIKGLPRVVGAGVAMDHFLLSGLCHIDDARNVCVKRFLDSTHCTDLLFVDADVGFTPEGLYRICTHEGDIVAGVYPRKEFHRTYPINIEADVVQTDEHGLIREGVSSVPAGFLRISRKVLEQMAEIRLDRTFRSSEAGEAVPIIFERGLKNGYRLSGDVAFCHWARELGYSITVDVFQEFIHEGPARFQGCLARDLSKPPEEPAQTETVQ